MTHVQPYPIAGGRAGLSPAVLSELTPREAIAAWCRARAWGWFNLKRVGDGPYRSAIWEASWPGEGKLFRFVTTPA